MRKARVVYLLPPTSPSPVERHQSNGQVVLGYVPFTLRFLADRAKGRTLSQCQHIVGDLILPIVWHLFMDALHSLRQGSVIGGRFHNVLIVREVFTSSLRTIALEISSFPFAAFVG